MTERRRREPSPFGGEHGLPYSKGVMARALMAVGVRADRAYELARRVEGDLGARGDNVVTLARLEELAAEILGEPEGHEAVRQLRRYRELIDLDRPILLLIGGATGTGKSTVATELAYRLGITRVTSTDFVRQTMRAFFSHEAMPTIHYSSFDAWEGVPEEEAETGDRVLLGFLEQTRNVLVGVRASIERALTEGWSTVLEGVHLVPGMLPRPVEDALVVECVLAIRDESLHAQHFFTRDANVDERRPVAKYLDHLAEIRRIQDYVVRRAERFGVPVVESIDGERTAADVMELVLAAAEEARQPV